MWLSGRVPACHVQAMSLSLSMAKRKKKNQKTSKWKTQLKVAYLFHFDKIHK
jgi:hypothetical protein